VTFVVSFAAVVSGEPNLAVLDAIDRSNMNAVSSDHFHMLLYASVVHLSLDEISCFGSSCRRLTSAAFLDPEFTPT
jgi:hypothetical protein